MVTDPAVRSVRVAVALCERFAELLKGPSAVSARKQSGALFGVSGNEEALSLRIGEVQQLYPEIWRHLDDARAGFAARGVDVSAFDKLRAAEGPAIGAAVDIKHTRHGAGQYAVDETVKSANFNREGHARAVEAARALMQATPEIDWAGIAKAEAEDPHIAAFTRATSAKRYLRIGLLLLVVASPLLYVGYSCKKKEDRIAARRAAAREADRLPASERAALDAAIARTRSALAAARQAWPAAVAPAALAALAPSATPCPFAFEGPTARAAESFVRYGSMDANYFGAGTFASFVAAEPIGDSQLAAIAASLERIASRVADDVAYRSDRRTVETFPEHVVFFVIDREVEPRPATGTAFTPGEVAGRGYVFSIPQRRIVCAGVVEVNNAPGLATSPRDDEARAMLYRDLEVQIRRALATGLRAI